MLFSIKNIFSLLFILSISQLCLAEIAVIVNPNNNNQLSKLEVRQIFLGKTHAFPNGLEATPLDLPDGDPNKTLFAENVLRKSVSSLNSYWSRMLFSSKGKPPQTMSVDAAKKAVASNKTAIAYIDKSEIDSTVKVLFTVP